MFMSGIADEAGASLETQLKAHKELGWSHIELRNVNGKPFSDLSESEFNKVCDQLAEAKMQVSCHASAIANWACKITTPFERDLGIMQRAIPQMKRLNIPFIRVMSYPNDNWEESAWRDEAVRRLKILAQMASDGGVTMVLENCDGWGSLNPASFSRIFELVNSSAFKAVYDTGNAAGHGDKDTWAWYQAAKPHIVYVHIKAHTGPRGEGDKGDHVWPDSGESMIVETVTDLLKSGYKGGFSIEPHMKAVIHEGKAITDAEAAYQTYVEYGRRATALVKKAMTVSL